LTRHRQPVATSRTDSSRGLRCAPCHRPSEYRHPDVSSRSYAAPGLRRAAIPNGHWAHNGRQG